MPTDSVYSVPLHNGRATVYVVGRRAGQVAYSALDDPQIATGVATAKGTFTPGPVTGLTAFAYVPAGMNAVPASTLQHPYVASMFVAPVDANGNFVPGAPNSSDTVALAVYGVTEQLDRPMVRAPLLPYPAGLPRVSAGSQRLMV